MCIKFSFQYLSEIIGLLKDRRFTPDLVRLLRDPDIGEEIVKLLESIKVTSAGNAQAEVDCIINFSAYARDAWIGQKASTFKDGARVLDAGAGQCKYRKVFSHCDYKTQDLAQYLGTTTGHQRENWSYGEIDYVCDIGSIPVPDASFDAVLCSEVLEHVPKPLDALSELSRVLVKDGRLFLTAPLASGLHQQPFHYYGGYTPHFYKKFLVECGLEIVELKPIGGLLKHVGQETHRVGRILLERAPDKLSKVKQFVLMDWLPRYFANIEEQVFVEEFTVGYLLEARKVI